MAMLTGSPYLRIKISRRSQQGTEGKEMDVLLIKNHRFVRAHELVHGFSGVDACDVNVETEEY
jgi:hypothetical protein